MDQLFCMKRSLPYSSPFVKWHQDPSAITVTFQICNKSFEVVWKCLNDNLSVSS